MASASAAVPIMRASFHPREYILANEVGDRITIVDKGYIDTAIATNNTNKYVFVRGGTLLSGMTQGRVVEGDIILAPGTTEEIKIRCVHASHAISPGVHFKMDTIAPRNVEAAIVSKKDQHEVWEAVENDTGRLYGVSYKKYSSDYSLRRDDLLQSMKRVANYEREVDEVVKKVPVELKGQVGLAIVKDRKPVGLEFFDSPDSWRVFSRSVAKNYSDLLSEEVSTNLPEEDEIRSSLLSFVGTMANSRQTVQNQGQSFASYTFRSGGLDGNYSELKGELIHLICAKAEA